MIDSLIPTWIDHGVNTMFPIEVGTWNASIAPWRQKYGNKIRGVGGMNKNVFSRDKEAIDTEIHMFPIEVGTWNASIAPWRQKYGNKIRGVGGMNKNVFSRDKEAIDTEIHRLKSLIALGGYIPCPDHRIAPDAE